MKKTQSCKQQTTKLLKWLVYKIMYTKQTNFISPTQRNEKSKQINKHNQTTQNEKTNKQRKNTNLPWSLEKLEEVA